jgi:hypothetical protein
MKTKIKVLAIALLASSLIGCAQQQPRPAAPAMDTSHKPTSSEVAVQNPTQPTPEQQYLQRVNNVVIWFETAILPQIQEQHRQRQVVEAAKAKVLAEKELAEDKAAEKAKE